MQSTQHCTISKKKSSLILFTYVRLGLPSGLFPSGFPTVMYMQSFSYIFVLQVLPISSSLISPFSLYLAMGTSYEAPYYASVSILHSLVRTCYQVPRERNISAETMFAVRVISNYRYSVYIPIMST
jgi:hypothetical protein